VKVYNTKYVHSINYVQILKACLRHVSVQGLHLQVEQKVFCSVWRCRRYACNIRL